MMPCPLPDDVRWLPLLLGALGTWLLAGELAARLLLRLWEQRDKRTED